MSPRRAIGVASALLLTVAVPPHLSAQRIELTTRFGYAAPAGTLFRMSAAPASPTEVRTWDGGGLDAGATAAWWLGEHHGLAGSVDFRFTRYYQEYTNGCVGVTGIMPGCRMPDPVDGAARQMVASLRFVTRQSVGERLRLGASFGPALIHFGEAHYASAHTVYCSTCSFIPTLSYSPSHDVLGLAVGLSAGYGLSSRVRFSAAVDDVMFRTSPGDVVAMPWTEQVTPALHQLTFSASFAADLQ
jgi:hypothetical protein